MQQKTTLSAAAFAAILVLGFAATGCGGSGTTSTSGTRKTNSTTLSGAGSTFVAPLVSAWISPVASQLKINVSYNAIGSGGGIAQIQDRTVDFGASDAPLTSDQFSACHGCIQIPWALAGTAVIYHLAGSGLPTHLKLTGAVLAQIYLGKITYWDDKAINAINQGVKIPHTPITVVHRSDGSGTTYNFTDYLSRVSPTWNSQVGTGTAVNWPVGVGAAHSSGVAAVVGRTGGAIGYADVDYALVNHLSYMEMQNRARRFVLPTLATIKAASNLDTHPKTDGSLSIVNPPNTGTYLNAYPISTYTYVIVPQKTANAAALKKLIGWAVTAGQNYGPKLFFQPLPSGIVSYDRNALGNVRP